MARWTCGGWQSPLRCAIGLATGYVRPAGIESMMVALRRLGN